MYHPHADKMVQIGMGMLSFFVIHPRDPSQQRVDRYFVFLLNAYEIDPGMYVPKTSTNAGLQSVDLEQPGVSRDRPAGRAQGR